LQERLIFQGTNTAAAPIKQASVYQSSALVFGIRAVKNPSAAKGYHAICSRCGAETTTVFVPDGIRPVFCKDCLSLKRQERKREEDNRRQAKAEELQALKNIPDPSPSLSLSSLRQARPVDFRGRPEKIVPSIKKKDFQEEGQDMAEDELIDFSRRPE
jgi:CxxC-x17-CxxC domain-containing protein